MNASSSGSTDERQSLVRPDAFNGAPPTGASYGTHAPGAPAALLGVLAAAVRRHRNAVLATLLIVFTATAVACWLIPRRATAQADLWLDHAFDETSSGATRKGTEGADPRARNTEIRVVTSNGLLAAVVDKLGLANVRGIGQPRDGALIPRAQARNIAIATLRDNFEIRSTDTSYAVGVSYVAPGPVLAAGILNQTLDSYVEERRTGGARGRERVRLRADLAQARDEAMRTQAALAGYRSAATAIVGEDSSFVKVEIDALGAELRTADAARKAAEARLGGVRADRADPAGVTSPRLADLRAQQRLLRSGPTAAGGAGPNRTEAAGTDLRVAALARDIAAETKRASSLADMVRKARDRVALLRATQGRLQERLRAQTVTKKELARLEEDVATAQDRFASLQQHYTAQTSAQRIALGTAYVISHANPAAARSFPGRWLFVLGGALAGLAGAIGVVALLEAMVKGFRSRQHLERALGIAVIGQVPDLRRTPDADVAEDDPTGPADYLYNHPRSSFAMAFRTIHTGLQLGGANGRRSIAVCSALQTEGKTTVAICLARSAAMAGLRVVLVDCDARRPAASGALSAHVEIGLVDVLAGGVPFRDALQRDTPSGAWFLAQSSGRPTPSEAVGSQRMAALVAQLRQEFDLVILDSPPALALAESRALAAMADGVLMVVRARTTPVGAARIAQRMLNEAGAKVIGATLTLVDP